eukprot:1354776-Pyramimonas_sp.AAC.1
MARSRAVARRGAAVQDTSIQIGCLHHLTQCRTTSRQLRISYTYACIYQFLEWVSGHAGGYHDTFDECDQHWDLSYRIQATCPAGIQPESPRAPSERVWAGYPWDSGLLLASG